VRIVEIDGTWTCPVGGAGSVRHELEPAVASARDAVGFDHDVPAVRRRSPDPRRPDQRRARVSS
jgi:DNA polymerase III subunit epsilon